MIGAPSTSTIPLAIRSWPASQPEKRNPPSQRRLPGSGAPAASPDVASDPGISLGRALEAQLGLKLEARKDPVEMLVVDHAQKVPTEN